ncbi:MAG: sulfate reduction electron transfer complex DsrMKJOP subunit DsrJ [Deltaproteobacteria bacterium]|nr:sulfate reduction electron transfer complex DsrMKJOP subunit DsrJ [Deltaproteobacteria bacterium]
MFNRGWVTAGILVFAAAALFPFYRHLLGEDRPFPQLELPAGEKRCVESKEFMRTNHMRLLDAWRNAVVRDDLLIYTSQRGDEFEMNLHSTCMGCHGTKERFCDRCHDYNHVTPPCWACHVAPFEGPEVRGQRSEVGGQGPRAFGMGGRS